jgi:hypothetical protein
MKYLILLMLVTLVSCGEKSSGTKTKDKPKELLSYKTPGVYIVEQSVQGAYKTPGVYIVEKSAFPDSVIKVCEFQNAADTTSLNVQFFQEGEHLKVLFSSTEFATDLSLMDFMIYFLPSAPADVQSLSAKIAMDEQLEKGELQVSFQYQDFQSEFQKMATISCQISEE